MTVLKVDRPARVRVSTAEPVEKVRPRVKLTAEELAVRAQGGSEAAFAELVDRFEARLYNFLLRRSAEAEDLTQEAFVRAWQRIGTYKPRWRFSTWLFTIGSRLAASHARKRPMPGPITREPSLRIAGDGAMERAESGGRVWALVAEVLSAEQQSAVWLRYVEGMAVKDIATVLGRTQVSVRVMLFRARGVLAERLTEDGTVLPASGPAEMKS